MSTPLRPLVALTTSWKRVSGSHRQPQTVLYDAYIRALEDAGLAALLISPAHHADAITSLLAHCHGLVLTGGGDIDPALYGEPARHELDEVLRERDAMEFAALRAAVEREVPVLGICRGIQLMNVCFGGTLYQDIDAEHPGVPHRQDTWHGRTHDVRVLPGTRLHAIVKTGVLRTNTFHHQAVRQVAPTLEVSAISEDGLVEAVEMKDYPWGLGVQWHPERYGPATSATDPDRLLFAAFAEAVHRRRGSTQPAGAD